MDTTGAFSSILQFHFTWNTTQFQFVWFLNKSIISECLYLYIQLELPQAMGPRCDLIATVVSSFSDSLQLLLFGGQNKWSETTIAETTLVLIGRNCI